MAIWSGHFSRCSDCASKCIQEPYCVSLLYNMANESCDLFNVIYDSDDRGEVDYYWVLQAGGSRWGKLEKERSRVVPQPVNLFWDDNRRGILGLSTCYKSENENILSQPSD
uniref:Apple domain-containing protein n=1 Tax=Magallana gigas TaxID=29159 RepID=A0A8W8M7C3_MAGGI